MSSVPEAAFSQAPSSVFMRGPRTLASSLTLFRAGLLTFASPCVLPMLPVYLSTLGGAGEHGDVALPEGVSCPPRQEMSLLERPPGELGFDPHQAIADIRGRGLG